MTTRPATRTCGFLHSDLTAATHILRGADNRFIYACDEHRQKHGELFLGVEPLPGPVVTETVPLGKLRRGEVVRFHGARLLIDQPIDIYPGRPGKPTVYMTRALISNYDDLAEIAAICPGGAAASIVRKAADRRWLIQGTKGTTCTREIPVRH
ncbi:hypothetical protein [Nocardia brasiliensis]|uniref:hypothetical protein n=1 Tax=Nocardia brasiliensis TaxID=37326 RepID=UPI0024542C2A|nr:hypothetical protein [Nocardia brasiliensis]